MDSTPANICYIVLANVIDAPRQEEDLQSIFIQHFGGTGFLSVLLLFAALWIRYLQGGVGLKDEQIKLAEERLKLRQDEKAFSEQRRAAAEEELRIILSNQQIGIARSSLPTLFCARPRDAWLQIQEESPCMIILDLIMPVMDGYELLERLSAKYSDIPILIVSGYVNDPEEIRRRVAVHLPPFEFLQKPFVLADLLAAIHKLTGNKLRRDAELLRVA